MSNVTIINSGSGRTRRQAQTGGGTGQSFTDSNGYKYIKISSQRSLKVCSMYIFFSFCRNTLTPVNYQIDVAGGDPDPFFVNQPSLDDIARAIANVTGLVVCSENCVPNTCLEYMLEV